MKNFRIASLLESLSKSNAMMEADFKNAVSPQSGYIPQDLQLIRVLDYIAIGIDDEFSREGNNAGQAERAKSVKGGVGNTSAHTLIVNNCVNAIMQNASSFGKVFSGLTNDLLYVPRLPTSSKENDDAQWDFLEACPAVASNSKSTMSLNTRSRSLTTMFKGKVSNTTQFYVASLLYGYIHEEQALAAVDNGVAYKVSLNNPLIDYDEKLKFLDEKYEAKYPEALALLKTIHSANISNFKQATPDTPEYDVKDLLESFRAKVPVNGEVYLSSNELKEFTFLLDYFKMEPEERKSKWAFNKKLQIGIKALEDKAVHFGELSGTAGDIEKIILGGGYQIVLGYSQDGDKTHTEVFNNKDEKIFVGYITKYKGQSNKALIPIYIATTNPDAISKLNSKIGVPTEIKKITLKKAPADSGYKKLDTTGEIKRTGGNDLVFQLPSEIYKWMYTEQPSENKNKESKPKAEKAANVATASPTEQTPPVEAEPTADTQTTQDNVPVDSQQSAKVEDAPAPDSNNQTEPANAEQVDPKPTASVTEVSPEENKKNANRVISRFGKQFTEGKIDRQKAIDSILVGLTANKVTGYDSDRVKKIFDKNFSRNSDDPVEYGETYRHLFGENGENIAKNEGPLFSKDFMTRNVKDIVSRGHKLTPEEIKYIVGRTVQNRGSYTEQDVMNAINSASPKMEARLPSGSFNLKVMLENVNRR